jgi:hypothetical protein
MEAEGGGCVLVIRFMPPPIISEARKGQFKKANPPIEMSGGFFVFIQLNPSLSLVAEL